MFRRYLAVDESQEFAKLEPFTATALAAGPAAGALLIAGTVGAEQLWI